MEKVKDITSYDYYKDKKPYRRILEEEIDLEIFSYMQGSPFWGNQYVVYDISYDMQKFIDNMPRIRERLLKTKIAKNIEEERQRILAIPDTVDEFINAYAANRILSRLVTDGCIVQSDSSKVFHWDVDNRLSLDADFNRCCAEKMKRPVAKIFEVNGWERESWNFYFDYPNSEDYEVLERLATRLNELGEINQVLGNSHLEVIFVPVEYDSINFEYRGGYMAKNNFMDGRVNIDKVNEIIAFDNNKLFDFLYKGGCRLLFK